MPKIWLMPVGKMRTISTVTKREFIIFSEPCVFFLIKGTNTHGTYISFMSLLTVGL